MRYGRIVEEERRLEARGRQPGQMHNPKGGRHYKRNHGEPEQKAQDNFTDPESRIMKTSAEGFQQCHNAQVAVEGDTQLIVAAGVTSNASDQSKHYVRRKMVTPRICSVEIANYNVTGFPLPAIWKTRFPGGARKDSRSRLRGIRSHAQ